jgi:hypothetical protein
MRRSRGLGDVYKRQAANAAEPKLTLIISDLVKQIS